MRPASSIVPMSPIKTPISYWVTSTGSAVIGRERGGKHRSRDAHPCAGARRVQQADPHRRVQYAQGWSRDATTDVADELRRHYVDFGEVPDATLDLMNANRR